MSITLLINKFWLNCTCVLLNTSFSLGNSCRMPREYNQKVKKNKNKLLVETIIWMSIDKQVRWLKGPAVELSMVWYGMVCWYYLFEIFGICYNLVFYCMLVLCRSTTMQNFGLLAWKIWQSQDIRLPTLK